MSGNRKSIGTVSGLIAAGFITARTTAQNTLTDNIEAEAKQPPQVTLGSNLRYQFEASVDNGGEISVLRFDAGGAVTFDLNPDLSLSLRGSYELDMYDVSANVSAFGGVFEPWEDIHTVSMGAIFSYDASNDLTVFAGPVAQFSRETDADWGDAFIAGGVFGASFAVNEDLRLGAGFGVASQIENDVKWYPMIIIDWRISEDLRLSNQAVGGALVSNAVELIYDFNDDWQLGVGVASEFKRFRLDDDGPAPDGVGEESHVPMWVRLGYQINENVTANMFTGFTLHGEIKLEDDTGDGIFSENYDSAALIGLNVRVRF